ncbi:MAG: GAP family protein [Chloroflexi bacterium]|nr:GAP family protein [Chloroflexota bacterium]
MGSVIGDILPFAIGVAISPVPIIAVILMLFSARAGTNGLAFLGGWVVGLLAVSIIVLAVSGASGVGSGTRPLWFALVKLVLGVLLLLLGWEKLKTRPPAGTAAPMPKWLQAVDQMTPGKAFGMGALLSGVNPKNLILAVGAALVVAPARLSVTDAGVAVLVFVIIGSASIAVPVLYYRLGGAPAKARLTQAKGWLGENNSTVMAVLLLIFGVVLIGKGIGGL